MSEKSQTQTPQFRLTKAKREVLNLLAEYFCLRVGDLADIVFDATPNESQTRRMRKTLLLLSREGLVNRLPYYDLDQERGGMSYVYGLSDKGVQFARNHCDFLYPKTFDEHSQRTLDHELEISRFHIELKRFCHRQGFRLFWKQRDLKHTVDPDALFAITDPQAPIERSTMYYFLEMERAKLGNYKDGEPQIVRKLGKYYDYYDTSDCEREWDFRRYRVVVVQRTDDRRRNLLAALAKQYRHRMFWLTTEPAYRENMAGHIFLTPKDYKDAQYSLLPDH